MAPHTSSSLYVGDLHPDVTETLLFEIFKQVGSVASIRLCRDAMTRRSLGYAYVNFHSVSDAENALESLNYTPIKNRPCRIMWSFRDPSIRKSGVGNIFIKNLSKDIDNKILFETFSPFGSILSCKVVTDENGVSLGYGFVHFEKHEDSEQSIEKMNETVVHGKKIFVGNFIPKREKSKSSPHSVKFTNVYVKNLHPSIDESALHDFFSKFGVITQSIVMRSEDGSSKGFGFVNFSRPEEAQEAVKEMSGKQLQDKVIYAGRALKKSERSAEIDTIREERNRFNLYVKNLEDTVDDQKLRDEFAPFGTITSAVVMKDDKGNSRGFGFVCFSTPEEATKALTEMNGRISGNKPLYVAFAQRRDVRRAQLEAQREQVRAKMAAQGHGNPLYPPPTGAPGAQVFYPLAAPLPGRQNFIYPQQMINQRPRWTQGTQNQPTRTGGGYQNNSGYGVSSVGQRSQRQPRQRNPSQVVSSAQNGRPQGVQNGSRRGFKYTPNARNQSDHLSSGISEEGSQPNLSPEDTKNRLGESLFPLIMSQEPQQAGKITGMLLESLEPSELIHLIESPDALISKILEARDVLSKFETEEPKE